MALKIGIELHWKRYAGILMALATVFLVEILFNTSIIPDTFGITIFQSAERRSFDMLTRVRGTRENAENVIMINIDDYTVSGLGSWPIPRDQYGAVMMLLSNFGARAVALDVPLPPRHMRPLH